MNDKIKNRLAKVLRDAVANQELSGGSIAVFKDGQEQCFIGDGYADLAAKQEIKRDTIFRLYSMSKPVTAVAAMILMERGELSLQAPVSEYLPAFHNAKVHCQDHLEAVENPMTVYDLLNMTSGLTYGDEQSKTGRMTGKLLDETEARLLMEDALTTQQLAEKVGEIPLLFQPGTSWEYGISADILGAVIEKVAKQPFGEFLETEIFSLLEMADTGFYVPAEKYNRLAKAYQTEEDGSLQEYTGGFLAINNKMDRPARFESGGAGLVSTVDDYHKFAQMLLQKGSYGKHQILQSGTVEYLTNGQLATGHQATFEHWSNQRGFSYGNMMKVLKYPEQAPGLGRVGEYGWAGWLGCNFVNCPNEQLTLLVMQQKKDSGQLVDKIRNVLFAGI